jgi:PEGA domain
MGMTATEPLTKAKPESRAAALFRRLTPYVALLAACALALLLILSLASCEPGVGRPAVSLSFERTKTSPGDAAVMIDEEYIGPLGYVSARGVRLPIGKHRISIEKPGYFPWDRLVEADREPILLNITLEPIPD